MDTAKIYHDSEGNECSIGQMISREPYWAANRLQEGERAIEQLETLEDCVVIAVPKNRYDCFTSLLDLGIASASEHKEDWSRDEIETVEAIEDTRWIYRR